MMPSCNAVAKAGDYSRSGNLFPFKVGQFVLRLVDIKFQEKSKKKAEPVFTAKVEVLESDNPDIAKGRKYDLWFGLGGKHDYGIKKWTSFLAACKGLPPNTPFDADALRDEYIAHANKGTLEAQGVIVILDRDLDEKKEAAIVDGKPDWVTKIFPNDTFIAVTA